MSITLAHGSSRRCRELSDHRHAPVRAKARGQTRRASVPWRREGGSKSGSGRAPRRSTYRPDALAGSVQSDRDMNVLSLHTNVPFPTGIFSMGSNIVTAGGLIFMGATQTTTCVLSMCMVLRTCGRDALLPVASDAHHLHRRRARVRRHRCGRARRPAHPQRRCCGGVCPPLNSIGRFVEAWHSWRSSAGTRRHRTYRSGGLPRRPRQERNAADAVVSRRDQVTSRTRGGRR